MDSRDAGQSSALKLKWMFRATELLTGHKLRGTLAVYRTEGDEWHAIFSRDEPGGAPIVVERPMFRFTSDDEIVKLPEPDNTECRDLGKAKFVLMSEIHTTPTPMKPSFELRGRLPATADKQVTAVASIKVPIGVRGG